MIWNTKKTKKYQFLSNVDDQNNLPMQCANILFGRCTGHNNVILWHVIVPTTVLVSLCRPGLYCVKSFLIGQVCVPPESTFEFCVRRHLRRCHNMSRPDTRFRKWSNGVERVERNLCWCISLTNNVKSCKKISGRAQTSRFSVFTRVRQELCAENAKKLQKLGKLKRLFLKFFTYYDPPRVALS